MGDWYRDLATGKRGEELVSRLLIAHPLHVAVDDVRDDPSYQERDIDFVWHTRHWRLSIDVKAERRMRENLFIETVSNCTKHTPGWVYKSGADLIAYTFLDKQLVFVFDLPLMRAFLRENASLYRGHAKTTKDGKLQYETEGALVPVTAEVVRRFRTILGRATSSYSVDVTSEAVIHTSMPELGLGLVVSADERYVTIDFESTPEPKKYLRSWVERTDLLVLTDSGAPLHSVLQGEKENALG